MSQPPVLEEVAKVAMELNVGDRIALASQLLQSAEGADEMADVEAAWDAEIKARIEDLDAAVARGEEGGRPAEEVLAELRSRYKT
jgi:putative addiction module component (TIGR02574 family)